MSIAVPPEASRSVAGTPPRVRTNSPKSTIISVRPRTRAAVGVSFELAQPFATTRAARERARGGFTPRAPARAGTEIVSERG